MCACSRSISLKMMGNGPYIPTPSAVPLAAPKCFNHQLLKWLSKLAVGMILAVLIARELQHGHHYGQDAYDSTMRALGARAAIADTSWRQLCVNRTGPDDPKVMSVDQWRAACEEARAMLKMYDPVQIEIGAAHAYRTVFLEHISPGNLYGYVCPPLSHCNTWTMLFARSVSENLLVFCVIIMVCIVSCSYTCANRYRSERARAKSAVATSTTQALTEITALLAKNTASFSMKKE